MVTTCRKWVHALVIQYGSLTIVLESMEVLPVSASTSQLGFLFSFAFGYPGLTIVCTCIVLSQVIYNS